MQDGSKHDKLEAAMGNWGEMREELADTVAVYQ